MLAEPPLTIDADYATNDQTGAPDGVGTRAVLVAMSDCGFHGEKVAEVWGLGARGSCQGGGSGSPESSTAKVARLMVNRYHARQFLGAPSQNGLNGCVAGAPLRAGVELQQIWDGSTDLSRFIVTYRWELWLVVGIPAIALILQTAVFLPLNFLLRLEEAVTTLQALQSNVVSLLLLAVSYLRVRRLGREYLALLWGIVTIFSAISMVAPVTAYIGGLENLWGGSLNPLRLGLLISGLAGVPSLLALLWFARQASRLSLTHAFFLVAFATLTLAGPLQGFQSTGGIALLLAHFLVGGAITLSVMLLKVWLVGNFELRGSRFRRNAVIGIVTAAILSRYVGFLLGQLIGFDAGPYPNIPTELDVMSEIVVLGTTTALYLGALFVLFALVYLVRVRVSAADARADWAG